MAPVDNSPASNMAGFELVCSLKMNDTIPVHKYKSTNTGINIFIAETDGPIVGGYFCLATETFDDDGLPHTLEHLVFLGSENYPYKGILDLVGNRCLASGTNAWTDRDHTAYTMTTVGSEGFLLLMPIYLDHILYPTLTESGFLTEVHHVSGKGEDAGVVYCEMQNTENNGEYVTNSALLVDIYPGKCGYKSLTGGATKNLRESTNIEKVRKYHKEFYRPENLTVIITGQVKHADVFKALRPLEKKIISKGDRGPFTRPWQNPIPPLTESSTRDVRYPSDTGDNGLVYVGWRGPSAVTELYELTACALLLKYLTDNSVSPVQKEFAEVDDPYASNVECSLTESSISVLHLIFWGVPMGKIPFIKSRLVTTLEALHKNGFDMTRMKKVANRHLLESLSCLEIIPQNAIACILIADALYGHTRKDLENRLNQADRLKKLMEEPESYWLNLLKKYLIDAHMIIINGLPSQERQQELEEIEKERIANQINSLGKEGLERKERELQEAVALNEIPIPPEILSSVPIPGTDSINFHPIKSYSTESSVQHPRFDVRKLPLYAYLNDVNTNFLFLSVMMDTSSIDRKTRPYLHLFLQALMESPVERNGKLISHEDIVMELEGDSIEGSASVGFYDSSRFSCGIYSQSISLILQFELSKYEKGIQWIRELLYDTKFTVDRLRIIGTKMLNAISQYKKKGSKISNALMRGLIYNKDSNHFMSSLLRQQKFLSDMLIRLNTEKGQKEVLSEIEKFRKVLTTHKNMNLSLTVNVDKLAAEVSDVYAPWKMLEIAGDEDKIKLHVPHDWEILNPWKDIEIQGCVMGHGSLDSAYLSQSAPCINNYEDPDLAPLLVCLQYLTQLEGPMWKQIRGQGLSYDFSISAKPNEGLLYLSFYCATNVIDAYKEAKAIVDIHVKQNKWDQLLYESARSSLIFKIIEREKSIRHLVAESLLSHFKNVSLDYNRQMVQRIYAVPIDDLSRVANKYLKGLFDPEQCKITIVCHPMKVNEITKGFKDFGHDLKVYTLENCFLKDW